GPRVDESALIEDDEVSALLLKLVDDGEEVAQGTGEAVELRDDQGVPRAEGLDRVPQLGTVRACAGDVLSVDRALLHAALGQLTGLGGDVLVGGRHARVADEPALGCGHGVSGVGAGAQVSVSPGAGWVV